MSKLKKAFVIYLVVSSVILHCAAVYAIILIAPAIQVGREFAEVAARTSAGQAANTGVVKDITTLTEGEYSYVGCSIDYKGQTLYVMGAGIEPVKVGDQVEVSVFKHPYAPLKGLMVMVKKKGS